MYSLALDFDPSTGPGTKPIALVEERTHMPVTLDVQVMVWVTNA
jgi:hypothetical protein